MISLAATILLVDDEAGVRKMVKKSLARRGYHVLEALTVEDAAAICETHPGEIHLLLTDVIMPAASGPALADQLKLVRPAMKVVFMSGYPSEVAGPRSAGFTDVQFLQKPFTPRELTDKVRRALDLAADEI